MQGQSRPRSNLDHDRYLRTQDQLMRLKSHLPEDRVEVLAQEVISRLADRRAHDPIDHPSHDQVEHLCHALLSTDDSDGLRYIEEARAAGASLEAAYLRYLTAAARMLGQWWDEDLVSFAEVSLGTNRMYAIMRALRSCADNRPLARAGAPAAIFASVPGETHTLGVRMAADLFANDGWSIDLKLGQTHEELLSDIAASSRLVVGLSVAGLHSIHALSRLVVALRIARPELKIFVGGYATDFARHAIELLDVDAMASDIKPAKLFLRKLWASL